ncbi:hypothetical protein [Henriciella litoralis]|uniref:hypothetical protein n=1 Tax=Henriciella litoralis TaxID=568102 RepID=UPI000A00AE30|nr:hypothetical protein [Henriciella litoralis]
MGQITRLLASILTCASLLAACTSHRGATTISPSGYAYNEAIATTKSEQLLLNLVRLKYRDPIVFMDIDGITTQHQYVFALSAENFLPFQNVSQGGSTVIPGASVSETPTTVYKPLDSSQFAQDLLAPITPETIVLLANSGWSVERIISCCIERIGPLSNAASVSGPTPAVIPDNYEFRQLAGLLRSLQQQERVWVDRLKGDEGVGTYLVIDDDEGRSCAALLELLKTSDCDVEIGLVAKDSGRQVDPHYAQTRTVLGALYALSHAVEVPAAHKQAGLTTQSTSSSSRTPDWPTYLGGVFKVRSGASEPSGTAVKIFYRDHWFWIDDSDLDSKTTFNLVTFLLALQSAASDGASPLLTINAGG